MVAEIGHFSLWLALAVAVCQVLLPGVGFHKDDERLRAVAVPAAQAQLLLALISFGALTWVFWVSDFSVRVVAENSHTLKPALYKITGVWANHEGSMLLWVTILALAGWAVATFGRSLNERLRTRVLSVQALIGIGFYVFLLVASNPFERLLPAPGEGNGLNPLLQDPGLAFHPPMLYLGYVGLSVTFSFAVAALLENQVNPEWARRMRPWVLAAWAALTGGLALGSWWAYYELGWGGWWFWDPVENAALMPWLAATALLHSTLVLEKRDALRNWTVLLAVLAFSLSMLGTFIVRSGLLTSVHSFAVDPERGIFILVLLALYIGGALTLYAWRAGTVEAGATFAATSREGSLVINNLLLAAILGTVFLGTLYPMALEAVAGEKISVGAPYFNATFRPLMVPVAALMAVGPFLPWRKAAGGRRVARRLALPALLALLSALTVYAFADTRGAWALLGVGLAVWLAASIFADIARQVRLGHGGPRLVWGRLIRQPRAMFGMWLAHLGVAVSIFGATASGAWESEVMTTVEPGQPVSVGPYTFTLDSIMPVAGPNYTAIEGRFDVRKDDNLVVSVRPQSRTYTEPPMETTEAGIAPLWAGDIYAVLGKPDGQGRWQVRLHWKPFMPWVWYGAALMMLGGAVSMLDRRRSRVALMQPHQLAAEAAEQKLPLAAE
ncbi:heme lyase CcmF/NrfE family subunit [Pedomonas mirosovicensis]|uniref:heme lyase CcmF/NrfE family subunit n=1 Tax=Pedomonas mirosovicensis TaxID=2908641 RepID=UPI002168BC9F|nr:heme lyase CcmF/NrfE family subunit [Pedomonas mirosovicensis]MCH8683781.1 heme lyase CcmF/NrfE family subunit [Pedomonas mirosovicensis]